MNKEDLNEIFSLVPYSKQNTKTKFIFSYNKFQYKNQMNENDLIQMIYEDVSFGVDINKIIAALNSFEYGKRQKINLYNKNHINVPELSATEWNNIDISEHNKPSKLTKLTNIITILKRKLKWNQI